MPGLFGHFLSERTPDYQKFVDSGRTLISNARKDLKKCKEAGLDVASEEEEIARFENVWCQGKKQAVMPSSYPLLISNLTLYVSTAMSTEIREKFNKKIINQIDRIIDLYVKLLPCVPKKEVADILRTTEDLEAEQKALPTRQLSIDGLLEYSKAYHATIDSLQRKELIEQIKLFAQETVDLAQTMVEEDENPVRKARQSLYHSRLLTRFNKFSAAMTHDMQSLQEERAFWDQTQAFLKNSKEMQDEADLADSQKTAVQVFSSMRLN